MLSPHPRGSALYPSVHPCSVSILKGYSLERNISPKSTNIYLLLDLAKKGCDAYFEEMVRILPSVGYKEFLF